MDSIENIFDSVAVPVIGLDCNFKIVVANREARKVFPEIALGAEAKVAISKKRRFRKSLRRTLDTRDETTTSISVAAGFDKEFRATVRAVSPGQKDFGIALVVTFEDRSRLQDVKAMRSEFVANVSHEIRSPLTAISGFVETLQGPARNDPEAREMFLGLMGKEITRMTSLVSDLLSLSLVEVKERRAPKKITNPIQLVAQVQASVVPLVEKRGKILVARIADTLPEIPGDHDDLVRMLINLLENAVNYSREGSEITLIVDNAEQDNPLGRPAIRISVIDQGDGIAPEEIPRLTERFYRVDKSRSRNVGGTGLGLAIVKHILVRHRGKIEIDSVPGTGSEFRVFLPLAKPGKSGNRHETVT